MVRTIFTKIASKVAQDSKEKSHESAVREFFFREAIARNVEGGGGWIPPPPPAGLALNLLKTSPEYTLGMGSVGNAYYSRICLS